MKIIFTRISATRIVLINLTIVDRESNIQKLKYLPNFR